MLFLVCIIECRPANRNILVVDIRQRVSQLLCRARAWIRYRVLQFEQMSNTITVRLPEDLAEWLEAAARKTGVPKGRIVREELERARNSAERPFLRWTGAIAGPGDLSMRKGFSGHRTVSDVRSSAGRNRISSR
jgi:predicted DNA binding CopG/RHH family protein